MGLILDTSVLIADERGKFDMPGFLRRFRPEFEAHVSGGRCPLVESFEP